MKTNAIISALCVVGIAWFGAGCDKSFAQANDDLMVGVEARARPEKTDGPPEEPVVPGAIPIQKVVYWSDIPGMKWNWPTQVTNKPSIPTVGTLNTTATSAQSTSSSESLSGNITLHKVAKTGSYNDLLNKPTIPSASDFVQKSGDTMTGNLTIDPNDEEAQPFIMVMNSSSIRSSFVKITDGTLITGSDMGSYTLQLPQKNGTIALESDVAAIVPLFNTAKSYSKGDLVRYDSKLYKAKQNIAAKTAWNASNWEEVTIASEFRSKADTSWVNNHKWDWVTQVTNAPGFLASESDPTVGWTNGTLYVHGDTIDPVQYQQDQSVRILKLIASGSSDGAVLNAAGFVQGAGVTIPTGAGIYSAVLGLNATSTNQFAFVYSGRGENTYGSHGNGTFNIDPVNGLAGFWIGETNLQSYVSSSVANKVNQGSNYKMTIGDDGAVTLTPVWKYTFSQITEIAQSRYPDISNTTATVSFSNDPSCSEHNSGSLVISTPSKTLAKFFIYIDGSGTLYSLSQYYVDPSFSNTSLNQQLDGSGKVYIHINTNGSNSYITLMDSLRTRCWESSTATGSIMTLATTNDKWDWTTQITNKPTDVSAFNNDAGYVTANHTHSNLVNGTSKLRLSPDGVVSVGTDQSAFGNPVITIHAGSVFSADTAAHGKTFSTDLVLDYTYIDGVSGPLLIRTNGWVFVAPAGGSTFWCGPQDWPSYAFDLNNYDSESSTATLSSADSDPSCSFSGTITITRPRGKIIPTIDHVLPGETILRGSYNDFETKGFVNYAFKGPYPYDTTMATFSMGDIEFYGSSVGIMNPTYGGADGSYMWGIGEFWKNGHHYHFPYTGSGSGDYTLATTSMLDGYVATNHSGKVRIQGPVVIGSKTDGADANGAYSLAIGAAQTTAGAFSSLALGYSVASNQFSFVHAGTERQYGSHGNGTFNVNPNGGLSGFWIGETNLATYLANAGGQYDHEHDHLTSDNGGWRLVQMDEGSAVVMPSYYYGEDNGLGVKFMPSIPIEDLHDICSTNAAARIPSSMEIELDGSVSSAGYGYTMGSGNITTFYATNKVSYAEGVVFPDTVQISFDVPFTSGRIYIYNIPILCGRKKTLVTTDYIKSKVQNVNVNLQSAEDTRVALTNLITILKNL